MKFRFVSLIAFAAFLGCDSNEKDPAEVGLKTKLHTETLYLQDQDGEFRPADKTVYTYEPSGKLTKKEYFTFDTMEDKFTLFSSTTFTYTNDKVAKIAELSSGNHLKIISYKYTGDLLTKINVDDDVDTQATIQYTDKDSIEIFYAHSNGRSFTYKFSTNDNNIHFERTVDDSHRISSKVINEFDTGINPYSLLGYTDIFFTNFSKNNKVEINGEYFTNMPQSVPAVLEYEYNTEQLPLKQTITYKSYQNGTFTAKSQRVFEYVMMY